MTFLSQLFYKILRKTKMYFLLGIRFYNDVLFMKSIFLGSNSDSEVLFIHSLDKNCYLVDSSYLIYHFFLFSIVFQV